MGGVVIGSTMKLVSSGQQWGALMINTGCNLDCPMCYLGKKEPNQTMRLKTANNLLKLAQAKSWDGVAIIGSEPLLDEESVNIVELFSSKIRTHIMTNGVNLEKFADNINRVERIDISLDGGPKTYSRNASFASIQRGVQKWKDVNGKEVYVINTLSQENISNVEDMLKGSRLLGTEDTFFSPYVKTLGGYDMATPLSIAEIVQKLLPFVNEKWKLLIDPYHAIFEWREWNLIKDDVKILPEKNKLIIDFDPGERVRRVEVNGREEHPFIALHPGIKLVGDKM